MKKMVMLAREITKKEIDLGIGTERSSTRLSPIFKTLDLNIPIKKGEKYTPEIPINPFEGTPMLVMPLLFIPHDKSYLFGTPSIIEKAGKQKLKPTKVYSDPGKGTGSPIIAASLIAKKDDILIVAACDQYHSPAVKSAVNEILEKMEKEGFQSGTVLTTGTSNPAFSYIKVKDDKAIEFMLKGTIPKDDMIAETMIVCIRNEYLRKQLLSKRAVTFEQLKEIYPYSQEELKKIQTQLSEIAKLMDSCKDVDEYLAKCPFCDFSKTIHRLLIPNMTYSTVKYQDEWDDLGDWQKIYRSPIYPKDKNGNVVFSIPKLISYTNCENSVIANFTKNKIIVSGMKNRIFAVGPRGTIDLPLDMNPQDFKKEVVKVQM
ncbi:MAG: hypothetical protein FK732_12155 [Asgard group archaeon]|nr:hypothetical protein [Asgard group archaeon]